MGLEEPTLEEMMESWLASGQEDIFEEIKNPEIKAIRMRWALADDALDDMEVADPDSYWVREALMKARNQKRTAMGLPLEGQIWLDAEAQQDPTKLKRKDRRRKKVSHRE
jgi:hypothetical protein